MGQATWESQGTGTNDYIVRFETSKNMAYEYRHRSNFGKLSAPMTSQLVGQGPSAVTMDVGTSAAIWSKEITSGDECRFTMQQRMKGAPTFGDAEVRTGDYLAYLHETIFLNKLDTPAIPMQEEMSRQRVKETIANPESAIRGEISMYLGEQYTYDVLDSHFMGASMNLRALKNVGGRSLDLGLGAGVQVSPENFIVAGTGFVSGTSGTSGYETALISALDGLNAATAGHRISLGFIHEIRAAITQKKIKGINVNGTEKWYVACDPLLLSRLTASDGSLWQAWRDADTRGSNNKVFTNGAVELEGLILFPEERLAQYRPVKASLAGGTLTWGVPSTNFDRRDYVSASNICLAVVLGDGAILEGHNGSVDITEKKGDHGKGYELAGHVKQSFMRARWTPKDGRSGIVLNQSSLTVAFADPGLSFGA